MSIPTPKNPSISAMPVRFKLYGLRPPLFVMAEQKGVTEGVLVRRAARRFLEEMLNKQIPEFEGPRSGPKKKRGRPVDLNAASHKETRQMMTVVLYELEPYAQELHALYGLSQYDLLWIALAYFLDVECADDAEWRPLIDTVKSMADEYMAERIKKEAEA